MNNVFAHPRDFAATVLQLRADPEADEHRPLDPLALPRVRYQQADGPTTLGSFARPHLDPEVMLRQREQAARLERLRQVASDLDLAGELERQRHAANRVAIAIAAAREAGEKWGTVAGWRVGFRHAIFSGVLIGVCLGIAATRLALLGSLA